MAQDLIPQYAALLRQHYLFQGLDEAQIAHVVSRFQTEEYRPTEVIISQGEEGDSFYLIFRGEVKAVHQENERQARVVFMGPGDYFGEEALLFDRPRTRTVSALEPTILLRLGRQAFFELLQQFPDMRMNLSSTAESRFLAQREKFSWLGEDELIYLIVRKHEFFLYTSLIIPVIAVVVSIPLLSLGFAPDANGFMFILFRMLGILFLLGGILLGIWNWLDWRNDFYIVTSQRVLWIERVIGLYNSRREAPLTQVLAVNVRTTWLGRMFNFGEVDVRTFTGSILMRRASHPYLFARFVDGFQTRARQQMEETEAEEMERALRQGFGIEDVPQPPAAAPEPVEPVPAEAQIGLPKPGSLREKLDTFLKVRYERGGVITYRKHWLLLLRKTGLPTTALLSFGVATLFFIFQIWIGAWSINLTLPLFGLVFFISLVLFAWWTYQYVDWSNDIYQLAPDQIRDIERKPLGEEQKKTAPLDSILSLEHTREGIIQLLFNYGDVVINVGQTQFRFRGVYNPDQVHQDVSDYIEVRARKKRAQEAARDRERMVDWLKTYRHQSQILDELDRDADWDPFPG